MGVRAWISLPVLRSCIRLHSRPFASINNVTVDGRGGAVAPLQVQAKGLATRGRPPCGATAWTVVVVVRDNRGVNDGLVTLEEEGLLRQLGEGWATATSRACCRFHAARAARFSRGSQFSGAWTSICLASQRGWRTRSSQAGPQGNLPRT